MKKINLENKVFTKLTVKRQVGTKNGSPLWECECECGNITYVTSRDLCSTHTKSCGCLVAENHPKTHNKSKTRLYHIWRDMKQRCGNKNNHAYRLYGARGIKVCEEWMVFETFEKWSIENGYNEILKIDRIDNDGDYEPSNCRWTTQKEQMNNVSYNRIVEFDGSKHTVAEWSDITGINRSNIAWRLNKGWDIKRTLTEIPQLGKNQYTSPQL